MNQPTAQPESRLPEPWLRGTLTDTPAVQRAVLHAFEAAKEDLTKWCAGLTDDEIDQRPAGLASVGFHLRHIPGSVDRLLTYAEDRELSEEQLQAMKAEANAGASAAEYLQILSDGLKATADRVRKMNPGEFEQSRYVGRKRMPTTVGGLLVHVAEHTQRHVGQAITTARILLDKRSA
jgi:uncharacterized damage-inducible protein DinB